MLMSGTEKRLSPLRGPTAVPIDVPTEWIASARKSLAFLPVPTVPTKTPIEGYGGKIKVAEIQFICSGRTHPNDLAARPGKPRAKSRTTEGMNNYARN